MMNEKLDEIFWWFEENKFENYGGLSRNANLVCEFLDWLETEDALDVMINIFDIDEFKAKQLIKVAKAGCNEWLK